MADPDANYSATYDFNVDTARLTEVTGGPGMHVTDGVRSIDLHANLPGFSTPGPEGAPFSLANPSDVVVDAFRQQIYVAAAGPGRVGVLNATGDEVLFRVDVGRDPRSLALDEANARLYVFNRGDLSASVVEPSSKRTHGRPAQPGAGRRQTRP